MKKLFLLFSFLFLIVGCSDKITTNPTNTTETNKVTIYLEIFDGVGEKKIQVVRGPLEMNSIPRPVKEGFVFENWCYDRSLTLIISDDIIQIDANMTLFAKYKQSDDPLKKQVEDLIQVQNIEKLYIDTHNIPILNKEDYVKAVFSYGSTDLEGKIRFRGNSSLMFDKKSYKVKLDKKAEFMGLESEKEFALVANHSDKSLIRNYLMYKLSTLIGMEYTHECKFVEVYLNQEYRGLYLLTESVNEGTNRVDIEEDFNENDLKIPFLLEYDRRLTDEGAPEIRDVDYFTLGDEPYAYKYPERTDITDAQNQYIRTSVEQLYLMNERNYAEIVDVTTFINYFLIQEISRNVDLGFSSVYLYKKPNSLITYGPVWDFDLSFGNYDYIDSNFDKFMKEVNGGNQIYNKLMEFESFKEQYRKRFDEVEKICQYIIGYMGVLYVQLLPGATKNFEKYDVLGSYLWPNSPGMVEANTYQKQIHFLKDFFTKRLNWLKNNI